MSLEREGLGRYFTPPMLLAYGWAYGFTVFAASIGLRSSRVWPVWLTLPAVFLGFGALFAIVIGLRPVLNDLTAGLEIREKLGLFILHGLFFIGPKLATPRASLLDCLVALQVPLVVFLIRRENFVRLYAVDFFIAAIGIFTAWHTDRGGFGWAAALVVFLVGCFVADRFFFELERYPAVEARPFGRPLLLAGKYAALSLLGGVLLYALTPQFATARRTATSRPVVHYPGGVQAVSPDALVRLVWDSFILMVLIVIALALVQWLKRKFGGSDEGEDSAMGGGVMRMVRKVIKPRPAMRAMARGFSPREQILRGYWAWCDEMERFGLARSADMTPKEFARVVAGRDPSAAPYVGELTRLFEWAKYDRRDLGQGDVETFFERSRRVIGIFMAALQSR